MRILNSNSKDSFIRYSMIDPNICDELVSYFEDNQVKVEKGVMGDEFKYIPEVKDSYDLSLNENDLITEKYLKALDFCLREYECAYNEALFHKSAPYQLSGANIQKYLPGGGFKISHYESSSYSLSNRILVYMTYLNDCDGGTYFPYQDIELKPKKGLTVIWPAGFTHLHKGITDYNKIKYIITGWFSLVNPNK